MYSSVDEYIANLLTREEIIGFLVEIERLGEAIYKTGEGGLEQVLKSGVGEKSARLVLDELQKQGKMADPTYQEKFFHDLAERLKGISIVSLELAVEPTREQISKWRDQISEYAKCQVAVDYKIVPKMIAGVKVAFGGKYADNSLESRWPEIWAAVKEQLTPKHDSR